MPLPEDDPSWLSSLGSAVGSGLGTAGRFGANTVAMVLGARGQQVPFPMQDTSGGAWQHPERQALAESYVPTALNEFDRLQRMETFRQLPLNAWPLLIRQFQKQDLAAADIHADPEAQALYREGGPQAWEARYPGIPLPPSRRITIKDYPPLDVLDQAIARIGGTDTVPLPEPITGQTGPIFPTPAPGKALAYAKDTRNLNTLLGGAPEDQRALQGLPPTLGYEAEKQRVLDHARTQGQFTPVFPGETPTGAARPAVSVDGLLGSPAPGTPAPAAVPSAATLAERFPPIEIMPGESMNSFAQRQKAHEADLHAAVAAQADAGKLAAANTDNFQKLNGAIDLLQTKITPAALPGTETPSLGQALKYKLSQDVTGAMAAHGLQSYTPVQPLYDLESTTDSLKVPLSRALGDKNVRFSPEMIRLVGQIFPNRYDTSGPDGTAMRKLQTLRAAAQAIQTGTPPAGTSKEAQAARDQWAQDIVGQQIAAMHAGTTAPATAAAPAALDLGRGFSLRLK
jgi:hypothetical protein